MTRVKIDKQVTETFFRKEFKKELKKYVTMTRFDDAMRSIAQSFERIEKRLDTHDGLFETIIQMFHQDQKKHEEFRKTLVDHAIHISHHERKIDNVTERLETLEKKA